MEIEAGVLVTPYGTVENAVVRVGGPGSIYAETVVAPGYADAHAHPQVVDAGRGSARWRNSVEWLLNRKLRVDEAALRNDVELCAKLTRAVLLKSLLEGTTLIAMVGSMTANLAAVKQLGGIRPRVVLMPTLINRRGWANPLTMAEFRALTRGSWNGDLRVGIFVHSILFSGARNLLEAYRFALARGVPFGIHLSEGRRELGTLVRLLGRTKGLVGVHCIENEDYRGAGIKVVQCPHSNLVLYGRTVTNLNQVEALGTDWPLLNGGMPHQHALAARIYGPTRAVLERATVGGYRVYSVPWSGDLMAFDEPYERVLRGGLRPRYVAVKGRVLVREGEVLGLNYAEVLSLARSLVQEAISKHPAW